MVMDMTSVGLDVSILGSEQLGKLLTWVCCFNVFDHNAIIVSLQIDCFDFDAGIIDTSEDWRCRDFEERTSRSVISVDLDDHPIECGKEDGQKQRSRVLVIPKVLKNDIRRCFAKMFVNTINAGEFDKMQEFVHTFMLPDCPFGLKVIMADNFGLPAVLRSVGPRMHVHYLLGGFVMYPDMVLSMGDSQIITSNVWTGTRIVIPFDCRMTKTHHIPAECWVPPADKVERMYAESSLEKMMAALSIRDNVADCHQYKAITSAHTSTDSEKKKRKRRALPALPATTHLVPQSFVDSLHAGAVPLDAPQSSHLQGEYTITLDENNRIQSIALVVMPLEN